MQERESILRGQLADSSKRMEELNKQIIKSENDLQASQTALEEMTKEAKDLKAQTTEQHVRF